MKIMYSKVSLGDVVNSRLACAMKSYRKKNALKCKRVKLDFK